MELRHCVQCVQYCMVLRIACRSCFVLSLPSRLRICHAPTPSDSTAQLERVLERRFGRFPYPVFIRCLGGCAVLGTISPVYNVEPFTIYHFHLPFSLASVLGKGQIGKGSVRVEKQWRTLTYELWHVKSRCSGRVWAEMTEGILT
jgi:hypothetical protein